MRKHYLLLTIAALALGGCSIIRPSGPGTTTGQPAGTSSTEPGGSGTEQGGSTTGGTSVIPGTSSTVPGPGGSSSSVTPTPSGVITLNSYSQSLDVYNEASNHTFQLEATITDPAYNVYTLGWRTTNSSIIHITQQGLVTAVGVESGKSSSTEYAYACLFDGSEEVARSEYCTFVVTDSTPHPSYITKVAFQGDKNPFIDVGEAPEYTVIVSGEDGDDHYNRKCSFENDNPAVVSIEEIETGTDQASKVRITALKGGTAHVTAKSIQDPTKTDVITVEVDPAITGIQEVKSAPSAVAKGGSINPDNVVLVVTLDNGGTREEIAWTVSCDTSEVGDHVEAKAYVQGHSEFYGTFYVRVYEGTQTTYTFVDKNYNDNTDASLSTFEAVTAGVAFESSNQKRGVQTTASSKKSECKTKTAIGGMTEIDVTWSTNNSTGTIKVYVGETEVKSISVGGTIANHTDDIQLPSIMTGVVTVKVDNTGSYSIYVKSVAISTIHMLDGIGVLEQGKVTYEEGDTFDDSGFVIVPKYTDGLGPSSEAFDHSELTFSPSLSTPLTTSNESVRISHGTDYVDVPITVSEVPVTSFSCSLPASIEHATIEGSVVTVGLNQAISFEFVTEILPANASDKRIEYTTTCADSSKVTFDGNAVSIAAFETVQNFKITAKALGKPDSAVEFTISVIDTTAPVLESITVKSFGPDIVAIQYAGQEFNGTGITLTAHYTNGKADVDIDGGGDDVAWYDCVLGENPKLLYMDDYGYLDEYPIDVSAAITIVEDVLTVSFSGSMTKTQYELSDNWDTTGLTITGSYASGKAYSAGFDIAFDPVTPSAMGLTESGTLTITATSKDGGSYHNSTTATVKVVGNQHQNTTNLMQGNYWISVDDSGTTKYLESIDGGKGYLTTAQSAALELTFTLVGDDEWEISDGTHYISIGTDTTSLNFYTTQTSVKIGWCDQAEGTRKIYSGTRGINLIDGQLRTYATSGSYNFNMILVQSKQVESITSISGKVTAKVGNAWNTTNLVAIGVFEGELQAKDITSLVDFTVTPPTATDETTVSVTATLKSDSSITYTNPSVTAEIVTQSKWVAATSIKAGDVVVIANRAGDKVMTTYASSSKSKYYLADAFDPDTDIQTTMLTVVTGYAENSFAFQFANGNYLKCTADKKIEATTELDNSASWEVTYNVNGYFVVKSVGVSGEYLQFNSDRFTAYKNTQADVVFYKQ